MFNANLFGFEGANLAGHVLEGPMLLLPLKDLLHRIIGRRRNAEILRLYINDDHNWARRVAPHKLINVQVARPDLGSGTVPADELLTRIHLQGEAKR